MLRYCFSAVGQAVAPRTVLVWMRIAAWSLLLLATTRLEIRADAILGKQPANTEAKKAAAAAKPAKTEAKMDAATGKQAKSASKKPAEGGKDANAETTKPAVYVVKKHPFRVAVALDGVFEAENMTEIVLRPQEWQTLSVLKAVEHGVAVKQGDLLLSLDLEKIDRAISDLQSEMAMDDLTLKLAEEQLAAAEKTVPLDLDANSRTQRGAEEDWKEYLKVGKPLMAKMTDYQYKMAQEMLEYQEEEYRQLEKMYRADDLREETEKIVLRRAKNGIERAKFNLEYAKAARDEAQRLILPRQEEKLQETTQRAEIDASRAKLSLPVTLNKLRLEFERLKIQRAQGAEKLKKLIADREEMTVKSPADGVVYYGRCLRGKWSSSHGGGESLHRGASLMANDVVMTIVRPRPLLIRATVPETQVENVRPGLKAVVEPTGFGPLRLLAVVDRVAGVPLAGGGFDARLTLAHEGLPEAIMPGMTCDLHLVAYKKTDAIAVPQRSVFTDDFDPAVEYVYVLGKDKTPAKRTVTTGKRNDKQVEILHGLCEGDRVLLEKPKEKD
jgi:multidrug resistance efflux pump